MPKKGYEIAINLAKEDLSKLTPEEICRNTGVAWDGSDFIIPWYNKEVKLCDGNIEEQIIWYHYMLANGPKLERNRFISYKQVPGAIIYNDNFIKRAINPMVQMFKDDLDTFLEIGQALGGVRASHGHMAFTLKVLPYVSLTYVIWEGDDEIPANGNILFDESAIEWFCAEDLVVLASLPVYLMMSYKRKGRTSYFHDCVPELD